MTSTEKMINCISVIIGELLEEHGAIEINSIKKLLEDIKAHSPSEYNHDKVYQEIITAVVNTSGEYRATDNHIRLEEIPESEVNEYLRPFSKVVFTLKDPLHYCNTFSELVELYLVTIRLKKEGKIYISYADLIDHITEIKFYFNEEYIEAEKIEKKVLEYLRTTYIWTEKRGGIELENDTKILY